MTARTHDLAAFTGLMAATIYVPMPAISVATLIAAIGANMFGGLFPDLDESTAEIWRKVRGGTLVARLISPLLGGHRLISHSLLGISITGWLLAQILKRAELVLLVDMTVVWWAFMLGYLSHLLADSLTREGVPWLFPLPWSIGFPPIKAWRIKTGGKLEKSIIFPGLILVNVYFIKNHYQILWQLASQLIR